MTPPTDSTTGRAWHKGTLWIADSALGLKAGKAPGLAVASVLRLAEHTHDENIFTIIFDSIAKYGTDWRDIYRLRDLDDLPLWNFPKPFPVFSITARNRRSNASINSDHAHVGMSL